MIQMKLPLFFLACFGLLSPVQAEVEVDIDGFGTNLGGWLARKGKAAEYELSEAGYRTYQPEISPSPDGGIFVSVRIDHRRGFFASDDHASLELSFGPDGDLVSAQSSLALQGRTISSELIKGGASASTSVAAPQIDRAVKIGTDLVADLSSKLLREKIVEPGRVSFPAAIRHNYNLLYKAVKMKTEKKEDPTLAANPEKPAATSTTAPANPPASTTPSVTPPATPAAATNSTTPAAASTTAAATVGTPPSPTAEKPATPASPTVPATTTPIAPQTPAAEKPTSAPAAPASATTKAAPSTAPTTVIASNTKKPVPLPDIKPYNPSGAVTTPLPAKKEKSILMEHGGEVLKLARDVVKNTAQ